VKGDETMNELSQRASDDLSVKYDAYGNMLFKLCMVILCNKEDAEDAVQDTFAKYLKVQPSFNSKEHEKAWFIRVASNCSKDRLRSFFRKKSVCLDDIEEYAVTPEQTYVLEQLMSLPQKYKTILHLHYVEGYKLGEIAELLGMKENAVKVALYRGREMLKIRLREELA
jgi:RNA polymerase sigma-70 factor (ECF subfamily)